MAMEKIIPLIIIFAVGLFLKKKKILKREDSAFLSNILFNIVIPIVIIQAFSGIKLETSLIYLPLSAIIVLSALLASGYLFSRLFKDRITQGTIITMFPTLEGGTLGYAMMLAFFGELGLSRIVLYDVVTAVFAFTVVYFISHYYGKSASGIKDGVLKIAKTPIIWAVFIGLIMNLMQIETGYLSPLFSTISGSLIFLLMLFLALEFEPTLSAFKKSFTIGMSKMIIGLILGFGVSYLFGLDGIERIAVIVASSLPPSSVTAVFAKENSLDSKLAADTVSISIAISIVLIPILIYFL